MYEENSKVTKKKKGKDRHYDYPSYPIDDDIPTIREMSNNHNHLFIERFPGNHNGLIWITRRKLNEKNCGAFIYATAIYAKERFMPSRNTSWQFWKNLKKLSNLIEAKKIKLTAAENQALKYMINEMKDQTDGTRKAFLDLLILDMERTAS